MRTRARLRQRYQALVGSSGARLAAALLGYFVVVILLLTLNPFFFELPERLLIDMRVRPFDIVENIVLFLPIGFLYRLTGGRHRSAILLGAALSLSIETTQLFIPVRTAAPVDLVSNTLGAAAGAWLYDLIVTRIALSPARVGRLSLEIPLMGLVYVLVPLLWMNALASEVDPGRRSLSALVGVCGAIVLSDIARAWWGIIQIRSAWRVALAGGAWFLLGSAPGLLRPGPTAAIGAGVALLAAALAVLPWRSADRRFERTTLRRVAPVFGGYLLLAALWPPLRPLTAWHGALGLIDRFEQMTTRFPASLLEYLAAFTVLGYVCAEWRGRAELPLARALPGLLLVALGCALPLELLAGFQTGSGASLVRLLLVIVGALFGAAIYHLLRSHVRFLLSARAAPPDR